MSLTYGFYNSINSDRKYNADQLSAIFDGLIRDGIFMSITDNLIVTASSGMQINVGRGRAWFNHTWTNNDAILPLTVVQSEIILNRIDTVVLEVDKTESVRANSIKIIKGTPSSTPVAPTLVKTEFVNQYPLCDIYVGKGVTELTQANITNRVGTSDCPFVTGILETINIDALIAQWGSEFDNWFNTWTTDSSAKFNTWFDTIKGKLSSDVAGSLQLQIDELKASPIKQQDTEPLDATPGTLWLDTSDTGYQNTELENLKSEIDQHVADNAKHVTSEIGKFKSGSSTFTNRGTSQDFVDSFCSINSLVTIIITSPTNPQGIWTVDGSDGGFTITSDASELTDISFDYYIQKAVG